MLLIQQKQTLFYIYEGSTCQAVAQNTKKRTKTLKHKKDFTESKK